MPSPRKEKFLGRVVASWRNQAPAIRVIRLWLGVTWIYGGWNKATDPSFLKVTGRNYIGTQLTGYANHSPLGFIFRHMVEHATLVGVGVMLTEFAIGIATLLWIAPTFIAFVGFCMSLGLWVAATWHVHPYFLGSDTAYAVLWLAYFLTLLGSRRKFDAVIDRRGALRVGGLGVLSVAAMFIGRSLFQPSSPAPVVNSAQGGAPNQIIKLADLAVGQSHEFATPDGIPAILFRTNNGVFAYSEICTHQGCTVSYAPDQKMLLCPCHGAAYDPFHNAAVVAGPAPSPLPPVKVAVSGAWVVLA